MRCNSNHWNCVDDNDYNVGVIYWSIFALSRVFDFLEQINPHSSPHAAYRIPSCKLWEGKRNERLHMIEWLLVFAVLFESRVKYLFMAMNSNLTLLGVSFNLMHNFSFSFYHFLMYLLYGIPFDINHWKKYNSQLCSLIFYFDTY